MEAAGICSACHLRPATRVFTAPIRQDSPIEEAGVCDSCYPVLLLTLKREEIEEATAAFRVRRKPAPR